MFVFIARRLLSAVPTVLGSALLLFAVFNLVGGDPCYEIVGKNAGADQLAQCRARHYLDRPKIEQLGIYLKELLTFDFGESTKTHERISDKIRRGMGPSLSLALPAFLFTTVFAIIVALLAAYFRGRWIDKVVSILCILGLSAPALSYILFGQFVLAYRFEWFPISGYETQFPDMIRYLALPALIWILVSLGTDVRFFRTAILDESGQDYVRTARAKGLDEKTIFFRHVLKNSLIPIVTFVVIEIPFLFLGSILLENYFSIPGLGSMIIEAINSSDYKVLRAMTFLGSLLYVGGQLVTDLIYAWVDPRVGVR